MIYIKDNGNICNHHGDPFKEQRFSNGDYEMPEDEWLYVDFD